MENWNKLKTPPESVLKKITGGRLSGMTDINPQWRYEIMTQVYGECGVGWKFEVVKTWTEQGYEGQVFAFASVNLYTNSESGWSDAIPGYGGSMLIVNERHGPHCNDEAFKMAITDALGTAMKMIGVAADIYMGTKYGSKYEAPQQAQHKITSGKSIGIPLQTFEKSGTSQNGNWLLRKYTVHGDTELSTLDKGIQNNMRTAEDEGIRLIVEWKTNSRGYKEITKTTETYPEN